MIRVSVFHTLKQYLWAMIKGVQSTVSALSAALPYLLNVKTGDLRKEITEQYPDPVSSKTADDLPPRSRGILANDIEKCTGCGDCILVCPTNCITIQNEKGPDPDKTWVAVYDIDFSRCMFCGLCAEACIPQSLGHTKQFEGSVYEVNELVASFGRGRITPDQRQKWEELRQERSEYESGFHGYRT